MRRGLRGHARMGITLALTLAFVGFAGVASAQQTCIQLDDAFPGSPSLLYRLTVTQPSNNTATVVGTATQGGATRVVTGGGALVGGQFELNLQGTDIVSPAQGPGPVLVTHATHVHLNGPQFTSGIFRAVTYRIFESGQGTGTTVSITDGTVAVILCPPQG